MTSWRRAFKRLERDGKVVVTVDVLTQMMSNVAARAHWSVTIANGWATISAEVGRGS